MYFYLGFGQNSLRILQEFKSHLWTQVALLWTMIKWNLRIIIYFYIFRNPSAGTTYNQPLSTKVTDLDSSFSKYGRHWPWNHSWEFGDDFCHTRQSAPVTKTQNLPNLRDGFGKITLCIKLFNKIVWIAEGKVNWL